MMTYRTVYLYKFRPMNVIRFQLWFRVFCSTTKIYRTTRFLSIEIFINSMFVLLFSSSVNRNTFHCEVLGNNLSHLNQIVVKKTPTWFYFLIKKTTLHPHSYSMPLRKTTQLSTKWWCHNTCSFCHFQVSSKIYEILLIFLKNSRMLTQCFSSNN